MGKVHNTVNNIYYVEVVIVTAFYKKKPSTAYSGKFEAKYFTVSGFTELLDVKYYVNQNYSSFLTSK